jgi:hypothetical protein
MTGDDGKREGMERVRRHCDPVWRRHADAAVIEAARLYPKLTTDDIVVMIPDHVRTHENRALGPVMQEAAKNGVIAKDMMPNVNCATRKNNHSRPLQVWRSLIYRRVAAE